MTYNKDGDLLELRPTKIEYGKQQEIGHIAKGTDMETIKSIDAVV